MLIKFTKVILLILDYLNFFQNEIILEKNKETNLIEKQFNIQKLLRQIRKIQISLALNKILKKSRNSYKQF